jgi:uncharacterized protein YbjT (DUF2867 family)
MTVAAAETEDAVRTAGTATTNNLPAPVDGVVGAGMADSAAGAATEDESILSTSSLVRVWLHRKWLSATSRDSAAAAEEAEIPEPEVPEGRTVTGQQVWQVTPASILGPRPTVSTALCRQPAFWEVDSP